MKPMNFTKYVPYQTVNISNRTWPDKTIARAPRWCSIDLRDGNQALSIPMSVEEKLAMFEFLVTIGFKEIEVGFPSASETEYLFVRRLIEENRVPSDVTIQVLTQARQHLIERTCESLRGAKNSIVHLYNSTSAIQRDVVFRKSREEIKAVAVDGTRIVKALKESSENAGMRFEYTPESFTGTELDYALEVCHAVMDAWLPTSNQKMIINLPSTVEMSTPNVYADRVEWLCRNIRNREAVIISIHTHNDRGTAVAAAELAVMAGAERVEGSLFGNGERSGNMDVVTMALNLFSQGIDPELDLSRVDDIRDMYTKCTRMEVHPRHPYAGDLVYTAFSGSHQDAINKGMKAYAASSGHIWNVPYLPIDPQDVGRTYESIIRINSQSGKGGIAYIMEHDFGLLIPKWMQADFGAVIQKMTDETGQELSAGVIRGAFDRTYVQPEGPYRLERCHIDMDEDEQQPARGDRARIAAAMHAGEREISFEEYGNGPVDAFVRGLQKSGIVFTLSNYAEHALTHGADSRAVAYVGIQTSTGKEYFGVGIDSNISIASVKAVVQALNRMHARG